MSYALNNIIPPESFSDTIGILRCPNSRLITVQTYNQAVYYQLVLGRADVGSSVGGDVWEPANGAFLGPGLWTFNRDDFYGGVCHAIRFRCAVPGLLIPATVTALA